MQGWVDLTQFGQRLNTALREAREALGNVSILRFRNN